MVVVHLEGVAVCNLAVIVENDSFAKRKYFGHCLKLNVILGRQVVEISLRIANIVASLVEAEAVVDLY